MSHHDRITDEGQLGIYASGLIEKGMREGHRLRAAALQNAFTRFRASVTGRH